MDRQPNRANRDQLLPIFWRQRWIVVLTTVLCLGAAVAYLLLATPIYTSTARMAVKPSSRGAADSQSFDSTNANYLYTQTELIMSPSVLALAAQMDKVKPLIKDQPDKIQFLQRFAAVDIGKRDNVLTVSFSSPDRVAAADICTSIVKAYQDYQVKPKSNWEAEIGSLKTEKQKLAQHIADLSRQQRALESKFGVLSVPNPTANLEVQRLLDERRKAQQELRNAERDNQVAKTQLDRFRARGIDVDAIDDDPIALGMGPEQEMALRNAIAELDQVLKTLQSQYGPKHPRVVAVESRLQRLQISYARIVQSRLALKKQTLDDVNQELKDQEAKAVAVSSAAGEFEQLKAEILNDRSTQDKVDARLREIKNAQELGMLDIDVFEEAKPELKPSHPSKKTTLPIAMVLGLILGGGLAFLRDWMDDRYRTVDEINESMGVPLLGTIPVLPDGLPAALAGQQAMLEPTSAIAEACRTIRTAIYFGAPKDRCRTVLVTSPASSDGKSTMASNLAITMAQAGKRVLLVDADLRLPTQHAIFGIRHEHGLTSVLDGAVTLDQAVQPTAVSGLEVLPCGPRPSNPAEMLNSGMFNELLEVLSERYDQVIIDSPPVMGIADARIIAAACDVTVLVLRAAKSTRRVSELARDGLGSVGANLLGIVINEVEPSDGNGYGYHGYARPGQQPQARQIAKVGSGSGTQVRQN